MFATHLVFEFIKGVGEIDFMTQLWCELPGQFILTQDSQYTPLNWCMRQKQSWLLATHSSLPVLDIFTKDAIHLGWLLGYPISLDSQLLTNKIVFPINFEQIQSQSLEEYLYEFGGRFLAIFINEKNNSLYLDPCGSLAVVYSLEKPVIASSSTLIPCSYSDYDKELIKILKMPNSNKWYPASLTPRKTVRRLLPNHVLNLNNFQVNRHWPNSETISINSDTNASVEKIASLIKNNIHAVAKKFPLHMSLTGGRDSRLLLACAKDVVNSISFFTICDKQAAVDCHIASKLAQRFDLNHSLLPVEVATNNQLEDWLYRSGYCVSGRVWENHQTLRHLDPSRATLLGLAGEVGRIVYRRKNDTEFSQIPPEEILKRLRLPAEGAILASIKNWWSEVSHFNTYLSLELMLIEQRLGCWAGPQMYGRTHTSTPLLFPFCHRQLFELMLALPYEYRFTKQLATDILKQEWPELLSLPFNKFTGIKGYTHSLAKAFEKIKKIDNSSQKINKILQLMSVNG